jgi:hypothetical protein
MPIGEAAAGTELSRMDYVARGHELWQMVRRAPLMMRGPYGFLRLSTADFGLPGEILTIQ